MPSRHLIAALALLILAARTAAAELRCPPEMPGPHAGFDQVGPVPTGHWRLDALRLFDGPPGEETKESPAELAPDESEQKNGVLTNVWRFGGAEPVLAVCTFKGSATYYRATSTPVTCTRRTEKGLTKAWCE